MAEVFDRDGWQVWIADVDGAALQAAPEAWRRTQLDVTDEGAVSALFSEIGEAWGGLDALCANAGVAGPTAAVEDIKLQDWQACVAVNLEGAFLAAKYAAPMMKAQGAGRLS
jgi:NAD(P)-dependent dehydrogenase (short-subunit alcohol dehydrogenase family)